MRRPSSHDDLGKFEPAWGKVFVVLWIALLIALALVRHLWPNVLRVLDASPDLAAWNLALLWFVLFFGVGGLAVGTAAVRRARLARFEREGRCVHCGYDVRATPDRCPECGIAPVVPRA